jgi:hypothetical protein
MTAAQSRRSWLIVLPFGLVVVLAAAWAAFWFFAASRAEAKIAEWKAQQERLGRTYTCGSQKIGGFPFRLEVRCEGAQVELTRLDPKVTISAKDAVFVAQVYDPTLLIGEFTGPLTVGEPGRPPSLVAKWNLGRASLRGLPGAPERVIVEVEGLSLDRAGEAGTERVAQVAQATARVALVGGTISDKPVLELAVRASQATAPAVSPLLAKPIDADIVTVLRGLKDAAPKPMLAHLRDFDAAGGRLQVSQARLQQGDTVAVATGELGLSPKHRVDGQLRLTVAGLDQFITAHGGLEKLGQAFGLDRVPAPTGGGDRIGALLGGLDRLVAGMNSASREKAQLGVLGFIGERTELERKQAVAVPLRFTDGRVFLGPIPLGETRPLF